LERFRAWKTGALLDDGRFNVTLIREVGRWEAVRHLWRLRRGLHTNHPKVRYGTGVSLSIETDKPAWVAVDGDLVGKTPVQLQVRPRLMRVLTL
jgi:diacylglycerol kinase family enzyme